MSIRWDEFLANLERYKRALPPDEPIVLPRREAKRRKVNKEKRSRIIFDTDETTYAQFHIERERMLIGPFQENPTIFGVWLCEVMGSWSDEMLENWVKAHAGESDG